MTSDATPTLRDALGKLRCGAYPLLTMVAVTPVAMVLKRLCPRSAVVDATATASTSTLQASIDALSNDERRTLMRVVYRCLAEDPASAPVYLRWHAALYESEGCGAGAVMHVLTDVVDTDSDAGDVEVADGTQGPRSEPPQASTAAF